jgi:hypothetical protein
MTYYNQYEKWSSASSPSGQLDGCGVGTLGAEARGRRAYAYAFDARRKR